MFFLFLIDEDFVPLHIIHSRLQVLLSSNSITVPWKSIGNVGGECFDSTVTTSLLDYCVSTK